MATTTISLSSTYEDLKDYRRGVLCASREGAVIERSHYHLDLET